MPTMRLRRPAPNRAPRLDQADWPRRPIASPDCHEGTIFISAAVERGQGGMRTARHVIAGLGFGRRRSQKVTTGWRIVRQHRRQQLLLMYDAKPARLRGNAIRLTIPSCASSSRPTIRFGYRS